MTVAEIFRQVLQLGFDTSIESDETFYYALQRALLQVAKVRPAIKTFTINHNPLVNLISDNTFEAKEGDGVIYQANSPKAYYFEADGTGQAYIELYNEDNDEWYIIGAIALSSNQEFKAYKGFIKDGGEFVDGMVRLRFGSEYYFTVRNVALYRDVISNNVVDINAYETFVAYNIAQKVDDFMAFSSPPIVDDVKQYRLNQDFTIIGENTIAFPYNKRNVYNLLYEHKPQPITLRDSAVDDTRVIDLDDELCTMLPYLVASVVWLEDEPEKAQYYGNLYREQVTLLEQRQRNRNPAK